MNALRVLRGTGAFVFVGVLMLSAYFTTANSEKAKNGLRVGRFEEFPDPGVYGQFSHPEHFWIVRLPEGKLVAISIHCTLLGTPVKWHQAEGKFVCPRDGSEFDMAGINIAGGAPRPLERHNIGLDGEFVIVDKLQTYQREKGQWSMAGAHISVPRVTP